MQVFRVKRPVSSDPINCADLDLVTPVPVITP